MNEQEIEVLDMVGDAFRFAEDAASSLSVAQCCETGEDLRANLISAQDALQDALDEVENYLAILTPDKKRTKKKG